MSNNTKRVPMSVSGLSAQITGAHVHALFSRVRSTYLPPQTFQKISQPPQMSKGSMLNIICAWPLSVRNHSESSWCSFSLHLSIYELLGRLSLLAYLNPRSSGIFQNYGNACSCLSQASGGSKHWNARANSFFWGPKHLSVFYQHWAFGSLKTQRVYGQHYCALASACPKQPNKRIYVFLSLRLCIHHGLRMSVLKYLVLLPQYSESWRHYQFSLDSQNTVSGGGMCLFFAP